MGLQHRQHHRQPARIPAHHGAARGAERGRRHQRLQFHQHRPGAFDAGEHRRARAAEIALRQEQFGRVGDLAQAEAGHLEHADLVGRPEPVLHRAQDAELLRAFALERQHRIDHVLDHAGAGDLAVLGDVADQDDRGAGLSWRSGSAPAPRRAPASPCRARIPPCRSTWSGSNRSRSGAAPRLPTGSRRCPRPRFRPRAAPARRRARDARRAAAPGRRLLRPKYRPRGGRPAPAARSPGSAASICRCRDRRRPAAPSRGQSRRR